MVPIVYKIAAFPDGFRSVLYSEIPTTPSFKDCSIKHETNAPTKKNHKTASLIHRRPAASVPDSALDAFVAHRVAGVGT